MTPEVIPDGDDVSRWIFDPHMWKEEKGLIWENVFMFKDEGPESAVWSKYVKDIQEVHELGCARAEEANERRNKNGKSPIRYEGAITARVGDIREIRSKKQHGFQVIHDPSERQGPYHSHILYNKSPHHEFTKQDKIQLKTLLRNTFSDIDPHSCEDAGE